MKTFKISSDFHIKTCQSCWNSLVPCFRKKLFFLKDISAMNNEQIISVLPTAWKVSNYGVISGLYFPVSGLNTRKYGPEITPYLDTFHTVPGFENNHQKQPRFYISKFLYSILLVVFPVSIVKYFIETEKQTNFALYFSVDVSFTIFFHKNY